MKQMVGLHLILAIYDDLTHYYHIYKNSDLLHTKQVTVTYEVSSSEVGSAITVTVDHGLGSALSGYAIMSIQGSALTNGITWYLMTSATQLRFISDRAQTATFNILYFYP